MHSAASVMSFWLPIVMDMPSLKDICDARALDYAVSYGRTMPGVHYRRDNIDGMNLGQQLLRRKLPQYLNQKYGTDPKEVEKKMEKISHDWNAYLTGECFQGDLGVTY
jgi:hypothetical protein